MNPADRPSWWLVLVVVAMTFAAGTGYVLAANWTTVDVGFLREMAVAGAGSILTLVYVGRPTPPPPPPLPPPRSAPDA